MNQYMLEFIYRNDRPKVKINDSGALAKVIPVPTKDYDPLRGRKFKNYLCRWPVMLAKVLTVMIRLTLTSQLLKRKVPSQPVTE